jgi:hypothetical protein
MNTDDPLMPDWKWGTAEGSRDLDRLLDRRLTFREKLEWLEEAEALSLQFRANREARKREARRSPDATPGGTGAVPS